MATCRVGRNVPRGPLGASFERPSAHETRLGWQQTSGGSHSSALLEIMFRQMMSQATRLAHQQSVRGYATTPSQAQGIAQRAQQLGNSVLKVAERALGLSLIHI